MPDVFGLGMTTEMPGFVRSFQSLIPFGLPLRTRNTLVEVYGAASCGNLLFQSAAITPFSAR
ncbi:hypothetical protein W911_16525 [Hyphomicrobium nitrativorans NL23]|uniref:Uncharacterized protein n=1 Tax=Hyphomicrobium nitrativorans NL23 TaxID=1029756 RepID=V5SIP9_9HYPH|nr:hypothetical protein W911_16525 [Hyphomicrobium nitrativorans NL23]